MSLRALGLSVFLSVLCLGIFFSPGAALAVEVSRMAGQEGGKIAPPATNLSKKAPRASGASAASSSSSKEANPEAIAKDREGTAAASVAPLQITDSIRRIESLGTLSSFSEGSLGRDIWAGTGRSDLATLFPALPSSLPSATVTGLLRRAMLTKADSSLLVPDADVLPGEDFLTLRLEQLLHQGAYQDALDLYARVKDKPYHPRLARVGVTAMILTGNVALACLELHSVPGDVGGDLFWEDLEGWCAASLDPAAGQDSRNFVSQKSGSVLGAVAANKAYRLTLRDFRHLGSLSVLERGVLIGESRIEYAPDFADSVADASADLLALPLYDKSLPPNPRIRITAECVRRGLLPIQSLADLYLSLAPPNAVPSPSDGRLVSLSFLFRDAEKSKGDQEKWGAVESALALQPEIGWSPLLPFASIVRDLLPGKISPDTAQRVAGLILRAGLTVPEPWGQKLDSFRGAAKGRSGESAALLDIALCLAREDPLVHQKINRLVARLPFREAQLLLAVSSGISSPESGVSENKKSYGNENPLTGSYNYVMPSSVVYDFLIRAGESRIPGKVILSSALVLQGSEPGNVYPGVLERVLAGYESVGLHHEARRLAVEAVLGVL